MRTLIAGLALWAVSAAAQNLTPAQKESDFRYLASLYATYYAPLDWKKQLFGFDARDVKPWLEKAAATTTDLDFYEVCAEYINSLNDTHVSFILRSDFVASLGFFVDLYDGRLLIDSLNRTLLPAARYPFVIGDELVSIDGENALDLSRRLSKYTPQGNPRAALRQAAQRATSRQQSRIPHAPDLGESATVVIRRQNGAEETYTIPWTKSGTPLTVGPVPSPRLSKIRAASHPNDSLEELRWSGVTHDTEGVNGYGARNPIYLNGLPSTFTRRLGGAAADFFYSGVFQWDGMRIGYIRIPNYSPPSQATAIQQLETEINFMNGNTDGLVIDEMRNTGGSLCFGEEVVRRLSSKEFRVTGYALRAYWGRVLGFYSQWINAKATNQPQEVIDLWERAYTEMLAANRAGRTVTDPLPICTSSLTRQPAAVVYRGPIMVIIDDFSTSTADSFAGMMQDNELAVLVGMRSNGAGGNNISLAAGTYSEPVVGMTLALQVRPNRISAEGFPDSSYSENVGVRPHVELDYMTSENLLSDGSPFVNRFLEMMAEYIRQQRR